MTALGGRRPPLQFFCNMAALFNVFVSLWLMVPGLMAPGASDVADAVMNKNAAAARALIQQKADVNAPQPDGTTALHWAVRWDDLETASALIQAGANAKAPNRTGATPMFLAAVNGSAPMIEALIKAGADPN